MTDSYGLVHVGTALQNLIICIEMMLVAIAHSYAYGYDTYKVTLHSKFLLIYRFLHSNILTCV
jgi:hypothetical protein